MYNIGDYISNTSICKISIHGIKSDTVGASIFYLNKKGTKYKLFEQGIYDHETIRQYLCDLEK